MLLIFGSEALPKPQPRPVDTRWCQASRIFAIFPWIFGRFEPDLAGRVLRTGVILVIANGHDRRSVASSRQLIMVSRSAFFVLCCF
ncbi:MAG: hypothetical protein A2341_09345 [Deltaproteobacteria bacterium RIFOXYB12_FULL_58_9]|nr:MAG: hypothetical protein A2341_09345 [Deltaproteobacteria bacterium RIFOXYB12_FULL_58_9]